MRALRSGHEDERAGAAERLTHYWRRGRRTWAARELLTLALLTWGAFAIGTGESIAIPLMVGLAYCAAWVAAAWVMALAARNVGKDSRPSSVIVGEGARRALPNKAIWLTTFLMVAVIPTAWLYFSLAAIVGGVAGGLAGGRVRGARRATPEEITEEGRALLRAGNLPESAVWVLADGPRPMLGFAAGVGARRRIYLQPSLFEEQRYDFGPVLAHEAAHHRRRDVLSAGVAALSRLVIIVCGGQLAIAALGRERAGGTSQAMAAALGFAVAAAAIQPLFLWLSRGRERGADIGGISLLGDGERYAQTIERRTRRYFTDPNPPRLFYALAYTHPAPAEIVRQAREAPTSAAPNRSNRGAQAALVGFALLALVALVPAIRAVPPSSAPVAKLREIVLRVTGTVTHANVSYCAGSHCGNPVVSVPWSITVPVQAGQHVLLLVATQEAGLLRCSISERDTLPSPLSVSVSPTGECQTGVTAL